MSLAGRRHSQPAQLVPTWKSSKWTNTHTIKWSIGVCIERKERTTVAVSRIGSTKWRMVARPSIPFICVSVDRLLLLILFIIKFNQYTVDPPSYNRVTSSCCLSHASNECINNTSGSWLHNAKWDAIFLFYELLMHCPTFNILCKKNKSIWDGKLVATGDTVYTVVWSVRFRWLCLLIAKWLFGRTLHIQFVDDANSSNINRVVYYFFECVKKRQLTLAVHKKIDGWGWPIARKRKKNEWCQLSTMEELAN